MIARSTASRFDVRRTDASPIRTLGVPPMRSSVLNEKPLSVRPSRARVMSTHASACFDSRPASKRDGPVGADVGHLGELGVAQCGAVLGLDLDCHALNCLRVGASGPEKALDEPL